MFVPNWFHDDTLYQVVMDERIHVTPLRRSEFPTWLVKSKFNSFLKRSPEAWKCFVTGVQCYALPKELYNSGCRAPWALTIDHLVPTMYRERYSLDNPMMIRLHNQALMGRDFNTLMGHIPLALKLLNRNNFRDQGFGHHPASIGTFVEAKRMKIALDDSLKIGGKYPWQPWTYDEADRTPADDFMESMNKFHEEFLNLDFRDRSSFFDDFKWRW